jgi:hypothetical protein
MIKTREEYEEALEKVIAWLEHPHDARVAGDSGFEELLRDIELYRPALETAQPPASSGHRPEADALARRAAQLVEACRARARRLSYSSFPEDGEGIGPTTGI